jgi:hypothetical protein
MYIEELTFRISDGDRIDLLVNGESSAHGEWKLDLSTLPKLREKLDSIEFDTCQSWDDIAYVGTVLWTSLTPQDQIGKEITQRLGLLAHRDDVRYRIRLEFEPKFASYPWETAYDERTKAWLSLTPTRPQYSIVYGLPDLPPVENFRRLPANDIRMLIIAPSRTKLEHAKEEINNLKKLELQFGIQVDAFKESVTLEDVHGHVQNNGGFHIVHFIGHGEIGSNDQRVELSLNDDDGALVFVDAERFIEATAHPRLQLVTFNCCRGAGSPNRHGALNGLGPLALNLGALACISMRYEIHDRAAMVFSQSFYESLFNGLPGEQQATAGRLDLAIREARAALSRDAGQTSIRNFATPLLHARRGCEHLFDCSRIPFRWQSRPVAPVEVGVNLISKLSLPLPLVSHLRSSRCLLILGPRIIQHDEITRRRMPPDAPPGIPELVEMLATTAKSLDFPYPDVEEISRLKDDPNADWFNVMVLQRVCQHLLRIKDGNALTGRTRLRQLLKEAYDNTRLGESLSLLLQKRFMGAIYTWFDGLLHKQVLQGKTSMQGALCAFDENFSQPDQFSLSGKLVLLRGSFFMPNTLVTTEAEHLRLSKLLARSKTLARLAMLSEDDYSVLILGASPRDALVKEVCNEIFSTESAQEGRYFAFAHTNPADQPFWETHNVEWINADSHRVLDAVLEASP